MVQQTLSLFETVQIQDQIQELPQEHIPEQYTAHTLLEETQQLFHSDGSEAELVALIQKAIDALHDLCNQTN